MSSVANKARAAYNRPNPNLSSVRRPVASVTTDHVLSDIVQTATMARSATTDAAYNLRIKAIKSLVREL